MIEPDGNGKRTSERGSTPASRLPVAPLAVALLLLALLALSYLILRDFLVPLVWATILVYTTWPLYRRLKLWLRDWANLSAGLMTLLLSIALIIPVLGTMVMLGEEIADAYQTAQAKLGSGPPTLPAVLAEIPWLGERLQSLLERASGNPEELRNWLRESGPQWLERARGALGAIGHNAFKLGITLLALFFLYRDGAQIVSEIKRFSRGVLGPRADAYWQAITTTTKGVVYGLVITALVQGLLAGLGYWVVGIGIPVLLGTVTALLALIPFGAPLVWGTTGLWLLATGEIWPGIGLLLWGALIIGSVDNVIRPLAISNAAHTPFFMVLLGVLGGLRAFGLVGLFLGPIILTVMLAVWHEWMDQQVYQSGPKQKADTEGE